LITIIIMDVLPPDQAGSDPAVRVNIRQVTFLLPPGVLFGK